MPVCLASYGYGSSGSSGSYGDIANNGYYSQSPVPSYSIPFVQQNSLKKYSDEDTKLAVGLGIGLGLGIPIVVALSVYVVYLYKHYTKNHGYVSQP
jgi:hypothetical protein